MMPSSCWRKPGITREAFLNALTKVRGAHRVTSQSPEGQYEALEKYGQDLTALPLRASSIQ